MKFFTPKIETSIDGSTGLKNYALIWYGKQLEEGINDLMAEAMRSLLPKLLIDNAQFQEKLAIEMKKAFESMQAEVLISIIKAAVREAIKEQKNENS